MKNTVSKNQLRVTTVLFQVALLASATNMPVLAKQMFFQAPAYSKLVQGAGPQTNDKVATSIPTNAVAPIDLAPLTLHETSNKDADTSDTVASDSHSKTTLTATLTATGFVPKGPVDPVGKSLFLPDESLGDRLSEKGILKQASKVGLMPLPLQESTQELEQRADTEVDAEKTQLSDLWEATLTKSPDIQFVIQKLMPTSNPGHTATVLTRMLGTAMFGAMGAMGAVAPGNMGINAGGNVGYSMIMNALNLQEKKNVKMAQLSQTETIMLYNMVRGTADRLVENYRNYKKSMDMLAQTLADQQALQNMAGDGRKSQDAAKQLEMEYTLRKVQRDVDSNIDESKKYRQALVDITGVDAVVKLDKQMEQEQNKILQATPTGSQTAPPGGDQAIPSNDHQQQTASAPGAQS